MLTLRHSGPVVAIVLIALLSAFRPEPAFAQTCLGSGDARSAAQAARVVPLSQIRQRIGQAAGGEVVSAQLCQQGQRYVYIVNVLTRAGIVRRFVVDAMTGVVIN
jgi:hypothetical protein